MSPYRKHIGLVILSKNELQAVFNKTGLNQFQFVQPVIFTVQSHEPKPSRQNLERNLEFCLGGFGSCGRTYSKQCQEGTHSIS